MAPQNFHKKSFFLSPELKVELKIVNATQPDLTKMQQMLLFPGLKKQTKRFCKILLRPQHFKIACAQNCCVVVGSTGFTC